MSASRSSSASNPHCRNCAGEEIFDSLHGWGEYAVYVACTPGGVEVAYPPAFLNAGRIALVPPVAAPSGAIPRAGSARFRQWLERVPALVHPWLDGAPAVVLVDDGQLPGAVLVATAAALRNAGVEKLGVATPWVLAEYRPALEELTEIAILGGVRSKAVVYGEPASLAAAQWCMRTTAAHMIQCLQEAIQGVDREAAAVWN